MIDSRHDPHHMYSLLMILLGAAAVFLALACGGEPSTLRPEALIPNHDIRTPDDPPVTTNDTDDPRLVPEDSPTGLIVEVLPRVVDLNGGWLVALVSGVRDPVSTRVQVRWGTGESLLPWVDLWANQDLDGLWRWHRLGAFSPVLPEPVGDTITRASWEDALIAYAERAEVPVEGLRQAWPYVPNGTLSPHGRLFGRRTRVGRWLPVEWRAVDGDGRTSETEQGVIRW